MGHPRVPPCHFRRGLGIAYSEPLYVLRVEKETNRVVLGSNSDLFSRKLVAGDFIWTCGIINTIVYGRGRVTVDDMVKATLNAYRL